MHYPVFEFIEFIVFSALFVIPSFFQEQRTVVNAPSSTANSLVSTGITLLILLFFIFQYVRSSEKTDKGKGSLLIKPQTPLLKKISGYALITVIMFTALAVNDFICVKLALHVSGEGVLPELVASGNPGDVAITVISLIISASFEELTYRWMFPWCLESILPLRIPVEVISVCMFAIVHLYLGWFAVLHALIAGILLRLCFLKSGSLIPGCIAHALLNLSAFYGIFNL